MGGMGGGMSGLFTQLLMNNPGLLQDPEVMGLMQDQAFINKLKYYEQTGNIQAMFSDPQITKLMSKLQGGMGAKGPSDSDMKDDEIKETFNEDLPRDDFKFDNDQKDTQEQESRKKEEPKVEQKVEPKVESKKVNPDVNKKKDQATNEFKKKN